MLRAPIELYDEGLRLTLARFLGPARLPYRDLWTLYGMGPGLLSTSVSSVLGDGILQLRLAYLLIGVPLVTSVFLLARRSVPTLVAFVLAGTVATIAFEVSQFHFFFALSLLLLGTNLVVGALGQDPVSRGRLATGMASIGLAFLGRYEFAAFSALLVLWIWWATRARLSRSDRRLILVAGLTPILLFGVYLLAVVGFDRFWLNLVEFPVVYYPKPFCRGLPTPWFEAFRGLTAPLRGKLWTAGELALGAGTYLPPLLGSLVLLGAWRRRAHGTDLIGATALGLTTWWIWFELRSRSGAVPHAVLPLLLVDAAILLGWLRQRRRTASAVTAGVLGVILTLVVTTSWLPAKLEAWRDLPEPHPRFGFADAASNGLFHPKIWGEVRARTQQLAGPGEPIFVALTSNTGTFANAPIFYWWVDRPPASRFIEFGPCLTDTEKVQRLIVEDLPRARAVILTSFFLAEPSPPGGSRVLDDYLRTHFSPTYTGTIPATGGGFAQTISVLAPRGSG